MDMHCHLLWGVDDGAHTLQDSRDIISLLKARGFHGAYCTPHIISRYPSNTPSSLKARFRELLDSLPDRDFDLRLSAEYMLDENFERMITEEEPLSHDGTHLLVELPQFRLPNAWMDMLQLVLDRGFIPVLAHPERYGKIMPPEELAALADTLSLDPRPQYQDDPERVYGLLFSGREVKFRVAEGRLHVLSLEPSGQRPNTGD